MLDLVELQRHACYQREENQLAAAPVPPLHNIDLDGIVPPLNQVEEEFTRVARYAHGIQRDELYREELIGAFPQGLEVGMAEDAYSDHLSLAAAATRRCGGGEEEMVVVSGGGGGGVVVVAAAIWI